MDRPRRKESLLDFPWTRELLRTSERNYPHIGFTSRLFYFSFLGFYLRCLRLLIQLVLRVSQCVLYGLRKRGQQQQKVGGRWLTSSKISNDVDGKPCSRWPRGNRSHVECFPPVWRIAPGYGFKWKTHCVLYCILLPFLLHFIVNWIYSEKIILC